MKQQLSETKHTSSRRLEGKIAIITGASRGIGLAAARTFAQEGSTVVLAARDGDAMAQAVEEIQANGGEAMSLVTDVTDPASVEQLVTRTLETYGRLDLAFNNAGVNAAGHPLAEVSEEEYDRVLAANLKGMFLAMKYEIRAMLSNGGGAIVNTSSVGGWSPTTISALTSPASMASSASQRLRLLSMRSIIFGSMPLLQGQPSPRCFRSGKPTSRDCASGSSRQRR